VLFLKETKLRVFQYLSGKKSHKKFLVRLFLDIFIRIAGKYKVV